MPKANPLKKITAEAKRIRRLHPNKHRQWKGYVKEAGEKYRKGTIGATRRKKPAARKRKKKIGQHTTRAVGTRKAVSKRKTKKVGRRKVTRRVVYKATTKAVGRRSPVRRHRMAGMGSGLLSKKNLPWILLAGVGVLYFVFQAKKSTDNTTTNTTQPPPLQLTTNPVRNQQSQDLVNYAIAGGLAVDAIIKLINSLNKKGDSEIANIYNSVDSGGGLPPSLYA